MFSLKSFKKNVSHVTNELLEIRKLIEKRNDSLFLENANNNRERKDKTEESTISYQLGKSLIDASKSVEVAIQTPRRLMLLRQESIRRKRINQFKVVSDNSSLQDVDVKYLNIQQQIKQNTTKSGEVELQTKLGLSGVFGIKPSSIFNVIKPNKVYVDNEAGKDIYVKSPHFFALSKEDKTKKTVTLRVDMNADSTLKAIVLFEVFDDANGDRIDIKMLPLNKLLMVELPDEAKSFKLGLKISGSGLLSFDDIKYEGKKESSEKSNLTFGIKLEEGISIIIPSYKGEKTIIDTLMSIRNQKGIDLNLLEVIVVINGEKDSTKNIITEFIHSYPELKIKVTSLSGAGASLARNFGIKKASREYIVFCDDDDMISENYLSSLYSIASKDSIGFAKIRDLSVNGNMDPNTSISKMMQQAIENNEASLKYLSSALTMIACKIIPTENIKALRFDENLKSGEDVSFFSEYFVRFEPKFNICSNDDAFYIRRLTENSVSRQTMSFDFNVTQRLQVIKELLRIKEISNEADISFVMSKVYAQCGFIVRYLREHFHEYSMVHQEILKLDINDFPYRYIQDKLNYTDPELLVISYCFPPFVDTSAVVASKRVYQFDELSDVVCMNMSTVRSTSAELCRINEHQIRDSYVLQGSPTFGAWKGIEYFSHATVSIASQKNSYKRVYSRSFWPASHFAAFEYKRRNPEVKWIAEFSDPVVLDIEGNERVADIDKGWVEEVCRELDLNQSLYQEHNMYAWCELIVFLCADEIIFTCENQKRLMLERVVDSQIINRINRISDISPHPTLPPSFYSYKSNEYTLDQEKVNFAYFGAFYSTRKLDDLVVAIKEFHKNKKSDESLPLFHIFTEQIDEANEFVLSEGLEMYFKINPYVSYLDFLGLTCHFDILIVNDSKASDIFGYNPYLPSKVSDYKGGKGKVWAFYEKGSALSKDGDIAYLSEMHTNDSVESLLSILREHNSELS